MAKFTNFPNGVDTGSGLKTTGIFETLTAARTALEADSGTVFVTGAVDVDVTLPAPLDGLIYSLFTQTLSVSTGATMTATGATIVGNGSAGATTLTNTAATDDEGDMVTVASDGTNWFVTALNGTWANS